MLCVPGLMAVANHAWAETEFNIDALDLDERTKIDLSQFADEGYILPGDYYLEIEVNKNKLPLQKILSTRPIPARERVGWPACRKR